MIRAILKAEADATKLQAIVADDCGLPKDGIDVGGGVHAPKSMSRTLYLDNIQKHPTKSEWATAVGSLDIAKNKDAIKAKHGLTEAEAVKLGSDVKKAAELGDDWKEDAPKAAKAEEKKT